MEDFNTIYHRKEIIHNFIISVNCLTQCQEYYQNQFSYFGFGDLLVYVVYQIHYSIWKVKFTSYNHIYSRMNLVVKTSGGYYFAHYIHFTRYGMHAYIELGFYPGGILRGKFYFLLQSYVFMILVFHWKERNLALGQKKRNGV